MWYRPHKDLASPPDVSRLEAGSNFARISEPCLRWRKAGVGAVIRRCSMTVLCISGRDTKIDPAKHALGARLQRLPRAAAANQSRHRPLVAPRARRGPLDRPPGPGSLALEDWP